MKTNFYKYLKYKHKYLNLKSDEPHIHNIGGVDDKVDDVDDKSGVTPPSNDPKEMVEGMLNGIEKKLEELNEVVSKVPSGILEEDAAAQVKAAEEAAKEQVKAAEAARKAAEEAARKAEEQVKAAEKAKGEAEEQVKAAEEKAAKEEAARKAAEAARKKAEEQVKAAEEKAARKAADVTGTDPAPAPAPAEEAPAAEKDVVRKAAVVQKRKSCYDIMQKNKKQKIAEQETAAAELDAAAEAEAALGENGEKGAPTAAEAPGPGSTNQTQNTPIEYTWHNTGKLGLILRQLGADNTSPSGVKVSKVTNPSVPSKLTGMVVQTVAGEDVSQWSYDDVLNKVKGAGRLLTMTFSSGAPGSTGALVVPTTQAPAKQSPAAEPGANGENPLIRKALGVLSDTANQQNNNWNDNNIDSETDLIKEIGFMNDEYSIIETIIDNKEIIKEIIKDLSEKQKIKIIKNSKNDIETDKNIMKIIETEINKLEQLKNFDMNTLFTFIHDKLVKQIEVEVEVDLNKGKGKSKGKGKDKSKGKGKGKDKSKGKGKGISKGKDKGKGQRAKDKGQRQISRQIQ